MLKGKITLEKFEEHGKAIMRANGVDLSESAADRQKHIDRCKKDYKYFFESTFKHYAKAECSKDHIKLAKAIKKKKNFRGGIEAFRGFGKSVHTNIGIPLWLMIDDEMKCMLLISDNETKAKRLLASVQSELENNPNFIHYWGVQITHGKWEDGEFTTKSGTGFFAIGLGQSPNGTRSMENRPDYIVVDDADTKKRCKNPMLVREAVEWIMDELIGTFDIGNERFILANNRLSKTSILATIHKKMVLEKSADDKWFWMQVKAVEDMIDFVPTWPEKYTAEYWRHKHSTSTMRSWEVNYMLNPVEEGTVFQESWIRWEEVKKLSEYDALCLYIDPAFTNNSTSCYKACRFWGRIGRDFHLIDCWVRVASIGSMVKYVYDLVDSVPKDVIVPVYMEANFMQKTLIDDFDDYGDSVGWYVMVVGDERAKINKFERIEATSAFYERGRIVYNVRKKDDPDFAAGTQQLLAFEKGSTAPVDAPDADQGALEILNGGYRVGKVVPIIGERTSDINW